MKHLLALSRALVQSHGFVPFPAEEDNFLPQGNSITAIGIESVLVVFVTDISRAFDLIYRLLSDRGISKAVRYQGRRRTLRFLVHSWARRNGKMVCSTTELTKEDFQGDGIVEEKEA